MDIRLFGDSELAYNGSPIKFGAPPRSLELLSYLALHRGPIGREKLAALLWPDARDSDARTDVRRHLYYLTTRALPDIGIDWFSGDKRTVEINPAITVRVDALEFERLASDPATLFEAIALYRADLLPTLEVDWIEPIRERLRERALAIIDNATAQAAQRGDHAAVVPLAERSLALDPWREPAARALMHARAGLGDRAGAAHEYREFAQRLHDDLGIDPLPETRLAYEAIVRGETRRSRGSIPTRLTRFFGREAEFSQIEALLIERPIVTLVGTGGVGKTRLAQEFARAAHDRYRDGVAFAELGPIDDPANVMAAIAGAVGVREEHGVNLDDALTASLRSAELLVVVDNCEHVVDAAAAILERLATSAPNVKFLTTSREPLRIEGEHLFRLAPLADGSASELFSDRARSVGAEQPSSRERVAISSICRRLDGIPLAIELAAARAYHFDTLDIERRLDDMFELLQEGRRTAEPRQQTLRAMIDWSVDLLPPDDRLAFLRISVMPGRFSQAAANAANASPAPLERLVEKSLLGGDERTFALLETTRRYARERLAVDDDADAASERVARYALDVARAAQATFRIMPRREWLESFDAEFDTIRGALTWAFSLERHALLACELAAELDMLMWDSSLGVEGSRWIAKALTILPPDAPAALVARCWLAAAWLFSDGPERLAAADRALSLSANLATPLMRARANLAFASSGQYYAERRTQNVRALKRARKLATPMRDSFTLAYVAHLLGDIHFRAREDVEGEALYAEAIALYTAVKDERGLAHLKINQAETAFRQGDVQRAIDIGERALGAMIEAVDQRYVPLIFANLANYYIFAGDAPHAYRFARDGFAIVRDGKLPMENAVFTGVFAALAGVIGDWRAAATLSACTEAQYAKLGITRDPSEALINDRLLAQLDAHFTPAERAAFRAEGEAADSHALIGAFPSIDERRA